MPAAAWIGRALAVVVALGLSVWGALFWLLRDRGPGAEAICRAAAEIRDAYRPGDHILLLPAHATRAREYLGDLQPVAPLRPAAEDFAAHPRTWVLGLFGAAAKAAPALRAAGLEPVEQRDVDGVAVELYRAPAPATVVDDLVGRVDRATVELRLPDGRALPCDRRRPRTGQGGRSVSLVCPRDSDWQYVAAEWHRMGDHPRRCLWAHPPNEGELWIHFPDVPLRGELHIRGGHTLHSRSQARAPVELTVAIDGWVERHAFALEDTWRPIRQDLEALDLEADTATVSFGVWSSDPGVNHFCFAPDVRRPGGTP